MKIVISGSSGLIGSALVPALRAEGHEVLRLVRRTPKSADEAGWDPGAGSDRPRPPARRRGGDQPQRRRGRGPPLDEALQEEDPRQPRSTAPAPSPQHSPNSTPSRRSSFRARRAATTATTGARPATESDGPADGFLAGVCVQWEAATAAAEAAGSAPSTCAPGSS